MIINNDKTAMQEGSHTNSTKSLLISDTFIPAIEKRSARKQIIIKIQQERFDSYQGIMAFLKNGF